jgi:sulfatase modifying factor 1
MSLVRSSEVPRAAHRAGCLDSSAWLLPFAVSVAALCAPLAAYPQAPPVPPAQRCVDDSACTGGQVCARGVCQSLECKVDKDCGDKTKRCIDMRCVTPSCDGDATCPQGSRCAQGSCWLPLLSLSRRDQHSVAIIPSHNFLMGNPSTDAVSDEVPAHVVEVSGFFIDRFEVTAAQYQACIDAGGCAADAAKTAQDWPECTLGDPARAALPINCVSWEGADAFCRWTGRRLPTEAEWELAAGGGDGRSFSWGNAMPTCDHACSNRSGGPGCGTGLPCVPGSSAGDVSVYGVVDMSGNVQEWAQDWYQRDYYNRAPRNNPLNDKDASGQRAVRGGSFQDAIDRLRIQSRDGLEPTSRSTRIGFRCASDG